MEELIGETATSGLIAGIEEADLLLARGLRVRIARIVRIDVPGLGSLDCSVRNTSRVSYDDPTEPLDHGGHACEIHDEPMWRLWAYKLGDR